MIPFRKSLARTRRVLGRVRELFPLSNLGLVIALLASAAYLWGRVPLPAADISKDKIGHAIHAVFGQGHADYVVALASVVALALVGIALVSVIAGALLVHRAFKKNLSAEGEILSFEAKRGFLAHLKMPAWRFFPLLELSWTWEQPEGFAIDLARIEDLLQENLTTFGRVRADEIVRRFVIEDSFGLAKVVLRRREKRTVRVLPWTGSLNSSPMLRSLAGGDDLPHPQGQLTGDRVDIRRYVPGDPLRLVLWKVYARTGELMVRTQERAIAPSVRIVAYLVSAIGDEPPAAASRVAIETGLLGDGWTFCADGANHPATDVEGAVSLIVDSRSVRDTERGGAAGLASFLDRATESEPARIVLFVPAKKGPWLERATDVAKKYGASMSVLIVTDGVEDPRDEDERKRRLERLLKIPAEESPEAEAVTTPAELQEIARAFAARGAVVMAIERPTGRTLSHGVRGGIPVPTVTNTRGPRSGNPARTGSPASARVA